MADFSSEIEYKEGGLMERRADQVLSEALELLENIRVDGLFHAIETGLFAGIKRRPTGGKGLGGVIAKSERYDNPFVDLFLAEQKGEQK
jgi:beta-lysine 5,6-aminomutase alpha subunit